jgi:hypothetical protein
MIRGVLIFGVGFGVGYVKALIDTPDIRAKLTELIELHKEENKSEAESEETVADPGGSTEEQGEST